MTAPTLAELLLDPLPTPTAPRLPDHGTFTWTAVKPGDRPARGTVTVLVAVEDIPDWIDRRRAAGWQAVRVTWCGQQWDKARSQRPVPDSVRKYREDRGLDETGAPTW